MNNVTTKQIKEIVPVHLLIILVPVDMIKSKFHNFEYNIISEFIYFWFYRYTVNIVNEQLYLKRYNFPSLTLFGLLHRYQNRTKRHAFVTYLLHLSVPKSLDHTPPASS